MQTTTGFKFVEETDLPLVRYVYELRLATIDLIAILAGRSYKRTADRLAKLEGEGYLRAITKRPAKIVYCIGGRAGVPLLIEQGFAPRELAEQRLRENELKPLGIQHALLVARIRTKFIMLTRERAFVIATWREGPSLWDRVETSGGTILPIRPDALTTLVWPGGKGRAHFFIEADRGTMAHSRMREKITAYAAWFQQAQHLKKHPSIKTFRVATITETRGRAKSLEEEYRSIMPAAWLTAYPVIPIEDLSLEHLMPEMAGDKAIGV